MPPWKKGSMKVTSSYSSQGIAHVFVPSSVSLISLFHFRLRIGIKRNGGVCFHSEEGVGTQMSITQYIMRIDTGRVDFSLYPGTGRVLLIDMQMAAQPIEAPFRRSN